MTNNKHKEMKREAVAVIETLENGYNGHYCDLHNEVFNTDYYIVGTYEARQCLNEYDVFDAIEVVRTYERDNFGECCTDYSDPKKLANMLFYVIGDEVITDMCDIDAFNDNWNNCADDETNAQIIAKLREMYRIE